MGYKILGYAVWQGAKWYLGRRVSNRRNLAIAGAAGLLVGGGAAAVAFAASRRSQGD